MGRTLDEVLGREPTVAERRAIDGTAAGLGVDLRDLPKPRRAIASALIRHLMLGGCDAAPVTERGVRIRGAAFEHRLDLADVRTERNLDLSFSEHRHEMWANGALLGGLALTGATLADGLRMHRTTVRRSVFLTGPGFHAGGTVDLTGAEIGGQLACEGARFEGSLDLENARAGQLWLRGTESVRRLDLLGFRTDRLSDDEAAWKRITQHRLDGAKFGSVDGDLSPGWRVRWLDRAHATEVDQSHVPDWARRPAVLDPDPGIYTRFAELLDAEGRGQAAAEVRIARERRVRMAEWCRGRAAADGSWGGGWRSVRADLGRAVGAAFGLLFGYGHRPARSLLWAALIVGLGAWLYAAAFAAGQMAPGSAVVLASEGWQAALMAGCAPGEGGGCRMPLHLWLDAGTTYADLDGLERRRIAADYETFSAPIYALDLFVPLDALGQQDAWAPSKDRGWLGAAGYYARWPIQVMGWIITVVGAAVVTGLVGRTD